MGREQPPDRQLIGGFSRLFDVISSEYNWTDETILDLPVCRARQIAAVIEQRQRAVFQQQANLTEWSTRVLAEFIAATVPVSKGKSSDLLKSAQKLRLTFVGDDSSREDSGPPAVGPEVFVEEGSQIATERNRAGSFEALMHGMGS